MNVGSGAFEAAKLTRGRAAFVLLTLAVLLGTAFRVHFQTGQGMYSPDSFHYLLLARSVAIDGEFASGGSEHPDLTRSPLFVLAIAPLVKPLGGVELAGLVVVVLASALSVVPLFFLTRRLFGVSAALASLPLGAFSCLAGTASRMLPTSLYVTLVLSALALVAFAARGKASWPCFVAGLLSGLAAITRSEGILWGGVLAAWLAFSRSDKPRARLVAPALVLAGTLAVYAPYVLWASSKLDRLTWIPGMEYLVDMRALTDELALREVAGPYVGWEERARTLLTADHRQRVIDVYFSTHHVPDPDPAQVGPLPSGPPHAGVELPPAPTYHVVRRRLHIFFSNLRRVPGVLRSIHLIPPAPCALGLIGLAGALAVPRKRRATILLVLAAATSLAPLASHLEGRFLWVPFALGLPFAAAGWSIVGRWIPRSRGLPLRLGVHGLLLLAVTVSGIRHEDSRGTTPERERLLRETAPLASARLPQGAILAVEPHLAFWAGRSFRCLPVAEPDAVIDFARANGVAGILLEGDRDRRRRPHLLGLYEDPPLAGLEVVMKRAHPSGGELRLLALPPVPARGQR